MNTTKTEAVTPEVEDYVDTTDEAKQHKFNERAGTLVPQIVAPPPPLPAEVRNAVYDYLRQTQGCVITNYETLAADLCAALAPLWLCDEQELSRLVDAGDRIAAFFNPGPIPSMEPTETDMAFADWEFLSTKFRAARAASNRSEERKDTSK